MPNTLKVSFKKNSLPNNWFHNHTHTHTFLHHRCVCTFPLSRGPFPCSYTCDPSIPGGGRVWGWRDGRSRWGSEWYLLTNTKSSYARKEKLPLLCTGPFVLYNQWVLWSLYGPDSVSPGLIYWSSVPGAHGSANNSHACTHHVGTSCVEAFTAGIRCLITTRKVIHESERWVFSCYKSEI